MAVILGGFTFIDYAIPDRPAASSPAGRGLTWHPRTKAAASSAADYESRHKCPDRYQFEPGQEQQYLQDDRQAPHRAPLPAPPRVLGGSPTPGNHTAEIALVGCPGRIRTGLRRFRAQCACLNRKFLVKNIRKVKKPERSRISRLSTARMGFR
jgi:hypothetical protein